MPPLSKRLKSLAGRAHLSSAHRREVDALIADLVRAECELDRARYRLQRIAEINDNTQMPRVVGATVVPLGRKV